MIFISASRAEGGEDDIGSHFQPELNRRQNLSHFQVSNPAANNQRQSGASGLSRQLGSSLSLNDDVSVVRIEIYFDDVSIVYIFLAIS